MPSLGSLQGEAEGLLPDAALYQALIQYKCSQGDADGAAALLEPMQVRLPAQQFSSGSERRSVCCSAGVRVCVVHCLLPPKQLHWPIHCCLQERGMALSGREHFAPIVRAYAAQGRPQGELATFPLVFCILPASAAWVSCTLHVLCHLPPPTKCCLPLLQRRSPSFSSCWSETDPAARLRCCATLCWRCGRQGVHSGVSAMAVCWMTGC